VLSVFERFYSVFRRVLSDIAVWIYQGITKVMEEEVQPFLVVALLEHEGIGGLSGQFSPVLRIRDPVPF
jgi:myosin-5